MIWFSISLFIFGLSWEEHSNFHQSIPINLQLIYQREKLQSRLFIFCSMNSCVILLQFNERFLQILRAVEVFISANSMFAEVHIITEVHISRENSCMTYCGLLFHCANKVIIKHIHTLPRAAALLH